MKTFVATLLGLLVFAACRKEIPFDDTTHEPKLSMNSALHIDSVVSVHIGQSYHMLDSDQLQFITNANVELRDANNNLIESLTHSTSGLYVSSSGFKPLPNTEYQLVATHPRLPEAKAKASIPIEPLAEFSDTSRTNYNGETNLLKLNIRVTDQPGEQFYMLEIFEEYYDIDPFTGDTTVYEYLPGFYRTSPILDNSGDYDSRAFFTDQLFQGASIKIDIALYYNPSDGGRLKARVTSLSKSLYLFYKSIDLYGQANGNPFAQPVQVYSNIENGYGVFGGFNAVWVEW